MKDSWNAFFLRWVPISVAIVLALLLLMIGLEINALLRPVPMDNAKEQLADLIDKQLWMRATEIMMGYIVGVLCVGVGIVFTWTGVETATKIDASAEKTKFALSTGSAGIVIVFVGAALVAATLLSPRSRIGPTSPSGGPESVNPPPGAEIKFLPFEL